MDTIRIKWIFLAMLFASFTQVLNAEECSFYSDFYSPQFVDKNFRPKNCWLTLSEAASIIDESDALLVDVRSQPFKKEVSINSAVSMSVNDLTAVGGLNHEKVVIMSDRSSLQESLRLCVSHHMKQMPYGIRGVLSLGIGLRVKDAEFDLNDVRSLFENYGATFWNAVLVLPVVFELLDAHNIEIIRTDKINLEQLHRDVSASFENNIILIPVGLYPDIKLNQDQLKIYPEVYVLKGDVIQFLREYFPKKKEERKLVSKGCQ